MMEIIPLVISASITILSLGLLIISIGSYRRYKNMKLLVVCSVFLIFLVKGILLSGELFFEGVLHLEYDPLLGVFDIVMLLLLFVGTLQR